MTEYIREVVFLQNGVPIWSWSQSYGPYIPGTPHQGNIACPPSPPPPASGVNQLAQGPTVDFGRPLTILVRVETPNSFSNSVVLCLDLNRDFAWSTANECLILSSVAPPQTPCAAPPSRVQGPTSAQAFDDTVATISPIGGALPEIIQCRIAAVYPNVCQRAQIPISGNVSGWVVEFPIRALGGSCEAIAINKPEATLMIGTQVGLPFGLASYPASSTAGTFQASSSIPNAAWALIFDTVPPLATCNAGGTYLGSSTLLNIDLGRGSYVLVPGNGTLGALPVSFGFGAMGPLPQTIVQLVVLDPASLALFTSQPVLLR